ncbi:MAG: hypothetical protein ABIA56_03625 [Actinomycetota bacterium]
MYTDIEFVCSGNNGRSPIAEAVAYQVLCNLRLQRKVKLRSSGTRLKEIKSVDDATLVKLLSPSLKDAMEIGAIQPNQSLEENPRQVLNLLMQYEERLRNTYISESGLRLPYHNREQTVVRPQAQLVLPVDEKNMARVQDIYRSSTVHPRIEMLGDFAQVDIDVSEGKWIKTYEEFVKRAEQIHAATRVATLRAIDYL